MSENTVDLDEVRVQMMLLRWAKQREKELADVKATARAGIEAALGDNEIGVLDGQTAVTWKTTKRRTLNQKALKEALPAVVEEYTDTTEVRTFKVFDE